LLEKHIDIEGKIMTKCDVEDCTEPIAYLPFTCKYCGGTFCKAHRLPENHKCGFQIKNVAAPLSAVPVNNINTPREVPMYQNREEERSSPRETRTARFQRMSFSDTPFISPSNNLNYTYTVMILVGIFFLLSMVIPYPYLFINLNTLIYNFQIQTIITSLFVIDGTDFNGIITLIFSEILFYMMGRAIESKFGGKFFITLYCVTGLITTTAILLIESLGFIPGLESMNPSYNVYFAANSGIFIGLITFFIYTIGLESRLTFYFFFVPVNLKAKYILFILILLDLIYGCVYLFGGAPSVAAGSFGAIAGVLAGRIMFGLVRGRMMNRWI
jgi:uncharacterized protein